MKASKFVSVALLSLLLAGLIANILPNVQAISGHEVSLPFYGLEELPFPDGFNTTANYPEVIETSSQLWVASSGTNASEHYRGGIWNWTGSEWIQFKQSNSNAGADDTADCSYRIWAMFNDTHHFFDEAGAAINVSEGLRTFTNDTGQHFYTTEESGLLGKAVYKSPINETFFLMHWGDTCVRKSTNLMDWTVYKNITEWVQSRGVAVDPAVMPHTTIGVSQNFHRLYVNYEPNADPNGGTDYSHYHWTIYQNLDTGECDWLNFTSTGTMNPSKDSRLTGAGTTFCMMAETSKVVVLGDTDRDASELKFVNVTKEDKRYIVDAIQGMNTKRGYVSVSQNPSQLVAKNDVIYVSFDIHSGSTYMPQYRYGIRISPDHGITWGTLLERQAENPNDDVWTGFYIYEGARHLYIIDRDTTKLYRMAYLTQKEAWAVLNHDYVSRSDSTVTFEKILSNQTTDAVDFSQYGEVSNANISLIGASYYNKFPSPANSGFEWGNLTSWGGVHISRLHLFNDSSEAYEGDCYGNYTATGTGMHTLDCDAIPWTCGLDAKGVVFSLYIKWNGTGSYNDDVSLVLYELNSTDASKWGAREVDFNITDSWQRINFTFAGHIKKGYDQIYLHLKATLSTGDSFLTDAWLIEECDPNIQGMPPDDKKQNVYVQADYFTSELKTQNPSVTINGQTFDYSGTLENNSAATTESITLPKTGIVDITSINIKGSGLVKIKIQATIAIIAEGIYLREYTNSVYVGHYYNASFALSGSQIVAFCEPFANITSAGLSGEILTLSISKSSGTSTSKVYCGSKGEPTTVTGATSSSYDPATKICTITVTHSSSQTITLDWSISTTYWNPSVTIIWGIVPILFIVGTSLSFIVYKHKDKTIVLDIVTVSIAFLFFAILIPIILDLGWYG